MGREFGNYEEEINLNVLATIFLLGLLILFGTYFIFFDEKEYIPHLVNRVHFFIINTYRIPIKEYNSIKEHTFKKYNSMRNQFLLPVNEFDLNSFKISNCTDCAVVAYFEEENKSFKVEYEIPHNKSKLSIFYHKIIEWIFDVPVNYGWVSIASEVSNADWSDYDNINFFVKGGGEPSRLEFSIYEVDGDAWYFFDEKALKTKDWVLVSMPFKDFFHPSWAPLGDGKKEFRNMTMFQMTITSFDREVNNTLHFTLKDNNLIYLN